MAGAAGPNELTSVQWEVFDPLALDSKANALGLEKANALADQMAAKFGAKVGQLLYVANTDQNTDSSCHFRGFDNNRHQIAEVTRDVQPSWKLFPQKVRRDASINVIFVLQ